MSNATNANMPAPTTPMVTPDGRLDPAWFRFLVALYNRTGAGPGGGVFGPSRSLDLDIPVFSGTTGTLLKDSGVQLSSLATAASVTAVNAKTKYTRGAAWTGSGSAITTPADDVMIECPVAGTITAAVIGTAGGTGSCSIDVWKTPYANFPPTFVNRICGTSTPAIVNGNKYLDTNLSTWQTQVAAGDWLKFHLNASSVFTNITIQLEITP